ncbi:uncharacterized protein LAESUDRAFT_720408 [Laetiporus sulphureus 93-53]|uniref:Uncharacterized protein n=1 Tax=Laetiporus sulphureus 93-53 TaxID=1314785 RepID=A0A165H407_9APHY|nr:uncharacterized protein LAESUDRAFT_720408 [Laetiporus sulphureus 93-53]KZT11211.1 hypothetical protein LAESUDRAFT_720408 [Laetiporus sulphureus 93-53]
MCTNRKTGSQNLSELKAVGEVWRRSARGATSATSLVPRSANTGASRCHGVNTTSIVDSHPEPLFLHVDLGSNKELKVRPGEGSCSLGRTRYGAIDQDTALAVVAGESRTRDSREAFGLFRWIVSKEMYIRWDARVLK